MPPRADEDRELRERVLRNGWRLDALDEWRRNVVDPTLSRLEVTLNGLARRDEIEAAVKDAVNSQMERDRKLKLTGWQRVGAILYGLAITYAAIGGPH